MRIAAIGAHIDDIEIGCGGTLAKATRNGHSVQMIVMCDSAYTSFDGKVLRTVEEAIEEGKLAAQLLGVEDLIVLDFAIKDVPYNSATVESLDRELSEFKPDLILTHWPFDTHQDHRNTALATISAGRYINNILMYEPFPPSGRSYHPFRPQVYFDVSETIDKKINALRKHESQYKKYGEKWIESILGRAKMRGFDSFVNYAEAYEVVTINLSGLLNKEPQF